MRQIYFLPGILGSELRLNNKTIWPPSLCAIDSDAEVDKLLDPHVVAGQVIRKVGLVFPMYSTILDALADMAAATKSAFTPWPYDWRLDLTRTCAAFAKQLSKTSDGDEIVIVAHSMGGLVARGVLEDPTYHGAPWRSRVTLAAFLATPHDGAMDAIKTVTGMDSAPGLTREQSKRLNSHSEYPACYQLFPPLAAPVLWSGADYEGEMLSNPTIWKSMGLDTAFLKPISDFRGRLDRTRKPDNCRYFAIVSAAHDTSAALMRPDANSAFEDHPFPTAGDGTVEIESACALHCQTLFVTGSHVGVTQADETIDCLRGLLGVPPERNILFALEVPPPTISVSPSFIEEGAEVEIVLKLGVTGPVSGKILITNVAEAGDVREISVDANVPGLTKLSLTDTFPAPGEFKLTFQPENGLPSNDTFVFVRRSAPATSPATMR